MQYPYSKRAWLAMGMAVVLGVSAPPAVANQTSTSAHASGVQVQVNDRLIQYSDAIPFIDAQSNRTMVPVRFVSEALGAKVAWEPATRQVKITQGNKQIDLTIGQADVSVDGKVIHLDAAPLIRQDRTFVPLRFVSEALGAQVQWQAAEKRVLIRTTQDNPANKAETLTIDQAVDLAMKGNADLKSLRLDVDSADVNARLVNAKVKEIPSDFVTTLEIAQQKYVNDAKAQMAKKVNAMYLKATENKIKLGAQKAFYDLLHAEAELALKQQSVERAQTQVKMAQAAFQVGTRAKTDVLQAQAGLAGAQAELADAKNNREVARMKLNQFIGVDLNKEWKLVDDGKTAGDVTIPLDEAIRQATSQRAEVLQKQEELKVAELNLELISKYSSVATYQGMISQNDVEKAKMAIEDAKRDVTVEVSQAYYQLQAAKEAIEATKKAKEAAAENYRLTLLRFENGMATTLEVLQAAEELSNREHQHQTMVHNYNLAVVSFQNALG